MANNQDFTKNAAINAAKLEHQIQELSSDHWTSNLPLLYRRDYKKFWAHAKEISGLFRSLKPLLHDDRERLWQIFNSICADVKGKQQSAIDDRRFKSSQYRDWIIKEVKRARPVWPPAPNTQELKDFGQVLRQAGLLLTKYKEKMLVEHKQECFSEIQEVRNLHDLYWQEIKKDQSKRQEEFHLRVRANLQRNIEKHRKASDAQERVQNHADNLREQIGSARSDNFRERACGWLSEAEDKIRDIKNSIQLIEGWIQENEEKLR